MIEPVIRTLLANNTAWPVKPVNEEVNRYPVVFYEMTSDEPSINLDGTYPGSYTQVRLEVTPVSKSLKEAREMRHQLRLALHGYKGTVSGTVIKLVMYDGEVEIFDNGEDIHHAPFDLELHYVS